MILDVLHSLILAKLSVMQMLCLLWYCKTPVRPNAMKMPLPTNSLFHLTTSDHILQAFFGKAGGPIFPTPESTFLGGGPILPSAPPLPI